MENNNIIIYENNSGVHIDVKLENETVWLNQQQISILFGTDRSVITKHIRNIYKDGELAENTTRAKIAHVVKRGFRGEVPVEIEFYNLDMILSVGYRLNSKNATAFRIWATGVLKKYLVDDYVVNQRKLAGQKKNLEQLTRLIELMRNIGGKK